MRYRFVLVALTLLTTPALAQQGDPVNQSGLVSPGHPMMWITNNAAGDAGSAAQGLLTGLGVTASGPSICANSGPVTAGYNQVCIGATSTGGVLQFSSFNGATGSLSLKGNISLFNLVGAAQCLQVNIDGVITGTGSPCGSGGGGGGPAGLNGQIQFNSAGVFGGISTTFSDGATIFIQSGGLALQGATSGQVFLNPQNIASGTISLPNGTDTLAGISLIQSLTNKTLVSPVFSGTSSGTATFNGNYTFNGANNFAQTAFLWNGILQTFPPSGGLVGLADTQVLTNKSINGSEINSGTVLAAFLPTATSAALGLVQGDGNTLTITAGTISCTTATNAQIGCSRPDGATITASGGVLTAVAPAAASVTIAITNVSGGTNGFVLYDNAGVLGNLQTTGSGNVVQATSPTLAGTIGGNLTFSGNLTATGLLTSGAISASLCTTSGGAIIQVSSQGCFGVGVLALNTLSGNLSLTGNNQLIVTSSVSTVSLAPVFRGYIAGLTLSNDGGSPTTVLDTAAGIAADSTAAVTINLSSTITKSISGAWAPGSGANGLGNGVTVTNGWYHVCLANNGGTADEWFDTLASCANRPAGITDPKFRRIGSFRISSAAIIAFTQNNDYFYHNQVIEFNSVSNRSYSPLTLTGVPLGVATIPIFYAITETAVGSSNEVFQQIGNPTNSNSAGTVALSIGNSSQVGLATWVGQAPSATNTSAQIGFANTIAAGSALASTLNSIGYIDSRGKDN